MNSPKLPELPKGEVTFLFTDVVGSSRLWEEHGDGFIPIWQAHDAVLRDAFSRFGGVEVKTEGDSFMVAFTDAASAIHCALYAQEALHRYPWPSDIGAVRVRMGLHTGEPIVHGNDYFGPVVNRAANTCKAAHGGQILFTEETHNKAVTGLDAKVALNDLGDHRLKDMGPAQRLYEAGHVDLDLRSFPPPRTLEALPHNLPVQRTSFVGRAKEIEQIAAYLGRGGKPLLTLTGPSGIGKTRLSLEAAAAHSDWFPDGVWYVKLGGVKDIDDAASVIAQTLGIAISPASSTLTQVREWLACRRCLLVLDDAASIANCDRLLREIVEGTDGLRCLATARESLEIDLADTLEIGGLATAEEQIEVAQPVTRRSRSGLARRIDQLAQSDAGRLFVTRAGEINPDLDLSPAERAAAQRLVEWLDGVPDSIERAAQMMDRFSPSAVLSQLERRLSPVVSSSASPGFEKLKGLVVQGAQKVKMTMGEAGKPPSVNLSRLIQGIANVAADRNQGATAATLGRESLIEANSHGDDIGVADALCQLARVKLATGDVASARAMMAAAAQLYSKNGSDKAINALSDLKEMGALAEDQDERTLPVQSVVQMAIGEAN